MKKITMIGIGLALMAATKMVRKVKKTSTYVAEGNELTTRWTVGKSYFQKTRRL